MREESKRNGYLGGRTSEDAVTFIGKCALYFDEILDLPADVFSYSSIIIIITTIYSSEASF